MVERALNVWSDLGRDELVSAPMDGSATASYASFGAGRSSDLTAPGRGLKDPEIVVSRTVAALHISGRRNAAAVVLPRFELPLGGRDGMP